MSQADFEVLDCNGKRVGTVVALEDWRLLLRGRGVGGIAQRDGVVYAKEESNNAYDRIFGEDSSSSGMATHPECATLSAVPSGQDGVDFGGGR
jgi:hypothetical protein